MKCSEIINIIGLLLSVIGVSILYLNSPLNSNEIDGGDALTVPDFKYIKKQNRWMKYGVYIIILSSIVQIISNICK